MEITFEQLEKNMQRFLNQPVIVMAEGHPHFHARGKTIRVERVGGGKPAMVVKRFDTGEEFFVFNGSDLLFLI